MNWLVYHLLSGEAFFSGCGLILCANWMSIYQDSNAIKLHPYFWRAGIILVILSTTPIPYWLYVLMLAGQIMWWYGAATKKYLIPGVIMGSLFILLGMFFEIPYHTGLILPAREGRFITIIGDSLSADDFSCKPGVQSWPQIMGEKHQLQVINNARVGDKTINALEVCHNKLGVVIVEIGGNDLLGGTRSWEFEKALDQLLAKLTDGYEQVVMLELPLPPFCDEYGRIQRKLAWKYKVQLIPKKVLLRVILRDGNTVDSLHLSDQGKEKMADLVWSYVSKGFKGGK